MTYRQRRRQRAAARPSRDPVADRIGPMLAATAAVVEDLGAVEFLYGAGALMRNSQLLRTGTNRVARAAGVGRIVRAGGTQFQGPFLPEVVPRGHHVRKAAGVVAALSSGTSFSDGHGVLGTYAVLMGGSALIRYLKGRRGSRQQDPPTQPIRLHSQGSSGSPQVYFPPPGGWPDQAGAPGRQSGPDQWPPPQGPPPPPKRPPR